MKQKMDILIVEPGKAPRPAALPDNTLEAVEAVLGGAAQVGCFLPQRVFLISREDTGGLAPNRCMPGGKGFVKQGSLPGLQMYQRPVTIPISDYGR